jgi:hypothetical protein
MQRPFAGVLFLLVTLLSMPASVLGQATTGSISGRVVSSDRQPLPGVTIVVTSPNLQGVRTTVTSETGDYLIPLLPPGIYSVSVQLEGFQPSTRTQLVALGYDAPVDTTMSLTGVTEVVSVVADAQPLANTAQVATMFKQDLMATLPSNRTIEAVMLMAPSVHATGPGGAFSINGSLSYENVYTVNGAVIVENVRGGPYPLYIEDALQEITVATAGVSAEYGRFSGGLVSAVTKSGGDAFSGSLRTSFANDYWRSLTPFRDDPKRQTKGPKPTTTPMYEATFGGPLTKQRLWFFSATRIKNDETARTTAVTNIPYLRGNNEKRYEGKLTYAARAGQSFQASYIAIDQVQTNFSPSSFRVMDLASLTRQRQPSDLLSLRYTGALSPHFSLEVQYSARHLTIDSGAPTRDKIEGTLLIDNARNNRYFSPTFCGVCEDEERDNDDFLVKGSYFVSGRGVGSHHAVFGYDRFNDKIFQNAYASGSDFRIQGTTAITPAGGPVYPVFLPNSTQIWWTPVEGSSRGSDLRMHSLFFNDAWRPNAHLTLNLGVRWDKNQAQDGGGAVVANKGLMSPRLAAVWDPTGEGRWTLNASYAKYVMPVTSNVAASTTAAGNSSVFVYLYQGPAINADANAASLVSAGDALRQLFNWFEQNGGTGGRTPVVSFVPGVNVQIQSPLKSPSADEYAIGTSRQLGSRGTLRVDGVWRRYHDFYSQRADTTTGKVSDALKNQYDLFLVENTNDVKRRYSGLTTQASYRIADGLDVGGNYTLSRLWGNFDGENLNAGPTAAQINAYPEYKQREWNSPEGDLAADQRHRARVWGTYAVPLSQAVGTVTFGILQQIGSGAPYGALGTGNTGVVTTTLVTPPVGYLTPQAPNGAHDYYFTARDAFRTATTYRTDLSMNYGRRLRTGAFQPELFVHAEALNIFNKFQLCGCGGTTFSNGGATDLTTIGQAVRTSRTANSGLQPFNPFTIVPVRGTHWDFGNTPGSEFGTALNQFAYTTPRLFRFSVGIRF